MQPQYICIHSFCFTVIVKVLGMTFVDWFKSNLKCVSSNAHEGYLHMLRYAHSIYKEN